MRREWPIGQNPVARWCNKSMHSPISKEWLLKLMAVCCYWWNSWCAGTAAQEDTGHSIKAVIRQKVPMETEKLVSLVPSLFQWEEWASGSPVLLKWQGDESASWPKHDRDQRRLRKKVLSFQNTSPIFHEWDAPPPIYTWRIIISTTAIHTKH